MDLKKLKIPELKKELTARGLALKGNKQELVNRLSQYLEENGESIESLVTGAEPVEPKLGDESVLDNGAEATDAILTPGAEDEGDLLSQEDEPSLLDDEEEETTIVPLATNVTSPVALQQQPVVAAEPKAEQTVLDAAPRKIIAVSAPIATELTPAQKKALRAERFNTPMSDDAKKQARIAKFGGTPTEVTASAGVTAKTQEKISTVPSEALEKLKKRSERFGTSVSPVAKKTDEMDRLMKRKQRFGVITNLSTGVKRTSTEGMGDEEARKKKRAERFGLSA